MIFSGDLTVIWCDRKGFWWACSTKRVSVNRNSHADVSQKLEWEGGEHVTVKPYSHVALWAAFYWDEPDQDQWSEIRDHSDHSTLKEPTNQPWKRILLFIWCSMIRVIPDHWSWSRSTQRNASFLDSVSVFFLKENLHAGKNCKL